MWQQQYEHIQAQFETQRACLFTLQCYGKDSRPPQLYYNNQMCQANDSNRAALKFHTKNDYL